MYNAQIDFWDVMGPVSLVVFGILIVWSVYGFKKKSALVLFVSGLIEIPICIFFAWSIGIYLAIAPIIQFIAAVYLLIKNRTSSN